MDASCTYPDHTYVHIVNEHGHLQGVFIRVQGRLIPIRLEREVWHIKTNSMDLNCLFSSMQLLYQLKNYQQHYRFPNRYELISISDYLL